MKFYIKTYIKKLFDVLNKFSLRKHSAKAVSRGFLSKYGRKFCGG